MTTEIRPQQGLPRLNCREVWDGREIAVLLAWRDLRVRYRQALLGVAWAVLQPLITVAIFSLLIARVVRPDTGDVPFTVFMFVAMLPWMLFARALGQGTHSLVGNEGLLTKVYLPRLTIPIAAILPGLADFACGIVVLVVMMLVAGVTPPPQILLAPGVIVVALLVSLGVSLWLATLNVRFRDVGHALPFLTQIWFFATPIFYSASTVPEKWRALYSLNPMVGVVEGFRWSVLGNQGFPWSLAASAGTALLFVVTGALYFRTVERTFADVV